MAALKNSNGRMVMAVLTAIGILVGLVVGSMSTWISAGERFVDRQQYERDMERLEEKIDQLLQFHLEGRRNGR